MTPRAHTSRTTTASPEAVLALWEDVDHWHEFDEGIEWARLDGDLAVGGTYALKPRRGPRVRATIVALEAPTRFVDVSRLPGARLRFDHEVAVDAGTTVVTISMTLTGPPRALWTRILGRGQQQDLDASTERLLARAERLG